MIKRYGRRKFDRSKIVAQKDERIRNEHKAKARRKHRAHVSKINETRELHGLITTKGNSSPVYNAANPVNQRRISTSLKYINSPNVRNVTKIALADARQNASAINPIDIASHTATIRNATEQDIPNPINMGSKSASAGRSILDITGSKIASIAKAQHSSQRQASKDGFVLLPQTMLPNAGSSKNTGRKSTARQLDSTTRARQANAATAKQLHGTNPIPTNGEPLRSAELDPKKAAAASANARQGKFGNLYTDNNGRQFFYMGKEGSIQGYAIDAQTMERIGLHEVAPFVNEANRIKDSGGITDTKGNAALRKLKEFHHAQKNKRTIILDLETDIKNLTRAKDYTHIKEIGIRIANPGDSTIPNLPGDKLTPDNLRQLTIITDSNFKNNKIGRMYRHAKKHMRPESRQGMGTITLSTDNKFRGNIISGRDLITGYKDKIKGLENKLGATQRMTPMRQRLLTNAKSNLKYMKDYTAQSGENYGFMFQSDFGPGQFKGQMQKFWDQIYLAQKKGTNLATWNGREFDDAIATNLAGKRISSIDYRDVTHIMYAHLYPEVSNETTANVNQYKSILRVLDKRGKISGETMQESMKFFGRGVQVKSAGQTSLERVSNFVNEEELLNFRGKIKELHTAGADAALLEAVMNKTADPAEFINSKKHFYAQAKVNPNQGVVHSTVRHFFADAAVKNMKNYHKWMAENKEELILKAYTRYGRLFDKKYLAETKAPKYQQAAGKYYNHAKVGKAPPTLPQPLRDPNNPNFKEIIDQQFGRAGVSSMLGSMVLGGVIGFTTDKMRKLKDKIKGSQDLEGMSHNSLMTVMRRLSMTDFGSSWRAFFGAGVREASKLLFHDNKMGMYSKKVLGAINQTFKQGRVGNLLRPKFLSQMVRDTGQMLKGELKMSSKSWVSNLGDKMSRFRPARTIGLGKRKMMRSLGRSAGMEKPTHRIGPTLKGVFTSKKFEAAAPWLYAGIGASIGINVLSRTHGPGRNGSPENSDVKPRGTYQKEAFRNYEHRLGNQPPQPGEIKDRRRWHRQMRDRAMSDALDITDRGITDKVSSSTKYRRRKMTDFGSGFKPDSPTTTEASINSMEMASLKPDTSSHSTNPTPRISEDVGMIASSNIKAYTDDIAAQDAEINTRLAAEVYSEYEGGVSEPYIRNSGLMAMKANEMGLDPITPFLDRTNKPISFMPEGQSGGPGLRMSERVLNQVTTSSKIDFLQGTPDRLNGSNYIMEPVSAGGLYAAANRDISSSTRIESIQRHSAPSDYLAGSEVRPAQSKYANIIGVTSTNGRSDKMFNMAPAVVHKSSPSQMYSKVNTGNIYGKMESRAQAPFRQSSTPLRELDASEVGALTFGMNDGPMGHTVENWNNNDRFYPT